MSITAAIVALGVMLIGIDPKTASACPFKPFCLDNQTLPQIERDFLNRAEIATIRGHNPKDIQKMAQTFRKDPCYMITSRAIAESSAQSTLQKDLISRWEMDLPDPLLPHIAYEINQQVCLPQLKRLEYNREWLDETITKEKDLHKQVSLQAIEMLKSSSEYEQSLGHEMNREIKEAEVSRNWIETQRAKGQFYDFQLQNRTLNQVMPSLMNDLTSSIETILVQSMQESHLGFEMESKLDAILKRTRTDIQREEEHTVRRILARIIAEKLKPHLQNELLDRLHVSTAAYIRLKDYHAYPVLSAALGDIDLPGIDKSYLDYLTSNFFPTKWDVWVRFSIHESSPKKLVYYWHHTFEMNTRGVNAQECKRIHLSTIAV